MFYNRGMKPLSFFCKVAKAPGTDDRILRFIGSDETVDRDSDTIIASGWDLDEYRKNPVILLNHKRDCLPVAKAERVSFDPARKALVFDVRFPTPQELTTEGQEPSDHAQMVDTLYNLYKSGYMTSTSVGFEPVEYTRKTDGSGGLLITKAKLFELSLVTIPANPNAVRIARSKGYSPEIARLLEEKMKTIEKAGARLSAESTKALTDIMEKLAGHIEAVKGCHAALDGFVKGSSGVEYPAHPGTSDGVTETEEEGGKSADLSGMIKELKAALGGK